MKICLLAEGCYPYVAGGVSAWVQMLIQGMPQHQFVVVAIGAEKERRGEYKYRIPSNVVDIREYFLDEFHTPLGRRGPFALTEAQRAALLAFVRGDPAAGQGWPVLFDLFTPDAPSRPNDFLQSEEFLRLARELTGAEYRNTSFKDLFWMLRSMLIPLLNLLCCAAPDADVYHAVATGYAGVLGAAFAHRTGRPLLVTEHGIYTREREEEILKAAWVPSCFKKAWIAFFRSLSLAAYHGAVRIVALFGGASRMQVELGAPEDKCLVIPNGIDVDRFAATPLIPDTAHPLCIGAVIRVVPIKDIKTMIYAFARVRQARPDARLFLIGPCDEDPEYYGECQRLIRDICCQGIQFAGRVDVGRWYGRMDLVLLTSISEGQPFVLLEAFAAHRPVVATNVGACREIIEGAPDEFGPGGVVVPVMDPAGIAAGILQAAQSPAHLRALAGQGHRRVCRYYRDRDFLARYEALYQEVNREWQASALN